MTTDTKPPAKQTTPPPARLRVHELTKRFGATVAVDRVSFSLQPGEKRAIVGENGAGKSTLMRIV